MTHIHVAHSTGGTEHALEIPLAMPSKKEPGTTFGKRLYALRKAQGLTQVQVADALGTTQRVISYYEAEAELPPAAALICLAQVLEVSADELLGLQQRKAAAGNIPISSGYGRDFRRWKPCPPRTSVPSSALINSLAGPGHAHAEAS